MKKNIRYLVCLMLVLALATAASVCAFAGGFRPLYESVGFENEEDFMEAYGWIGAYKDLDYGWYEARYQEKMVRLQNDPTEALEYWNYQTIEDLDAEIAQGWWDSREEFYTQVCLYMVMDEVYDYKPALSVQFDGEKVVFPDAQPHISNARTMVPFRAMAETMGFTVDWADGLIKASRDGKSIEFFIGKTEYLITDASGESTGSMDTAPYIRENRTYVPVRFFAEAFDLTVLWDEEVNQAVIYDPKALAAEIDKDFTIVNQWLAAQKPVDITVNQKIEEAVEAKITIFDSMNGNSVYNLKSDCTLLGNIEGFELHEAVDIKDLYDLLIESIKNSPFSSQEDLDEVQALVPSDLNLKNLTMDILYDGESDTVYFRSPVFSALLKALDDDEIPEELKKMSADTWLKFSGLSAFADDYLGLDGEQLLPTVGNMILIFEENSGSYFGVNDIVDSIREDAAVIRALAGDDQFSSAKGGYKTRIDMQKIAKATGTEGELPDQIVFDIDLLLNTQSGAVVIDFCFEEPGVGIIKLNADADSSKSVYSMEMHIKNLCKIVVEGELTVKESSEKPDTLPSGKDKQIDVNKLYDEYNSFTYNQDYNELFYQD